MELKKINNDARGYIETLIGDFTNLEEVTIFRTKANKARGGCLHPESKEMLIVLEGTIQYIYGEDSTTILLGPNDYFILPPNSPHFFISLTDSIVMEWGPSKKEKQEKYLPFRKIVDKINAA